MQKKKNRWESEMMRRVLQALWIAAAGIAMRCNGNKQEKKGNGYVVL